VSAAICDIPAALKLLDEIFLMPMKGCCRSGTPICESATLPGDTNIVSDLVRNPQGAVEQRIARLEAKASR
jgi:hypothetical protein